MLESCPTLHSMAMFVCSEVESRPECTACDTLHSRTTNLNEGWRWYHGFTASCFPACPRKKTSESCAPTYWLVSSVVAPCSTQTASSHAAVTSWRHTILHTTSCMEHNRTAVTSVYHWQINTSHSLDQMLRLPGERLCKAESLSRRPFAFPNHFPFTQT